MLLWVKEDKTPVAPEFTGNPDVMIDLPAESGGLEIFKHFLTDEQIEVIVEETNVYTNQYIRNHPELVPHSLARTWKDVTEIKSFWHCVYLWEILIKLPFTYTVKIHCY